ncbi:2-isopropylmalate synthase [Salinispira pacifica]|uniref:2-isopropylmalate synthase n=1 Tax=Salinispira pacifica TaxID=1307761 RepID=V5WIY2_9SPIO|nr:2-isopropylmalate synthase [Salinispira pacifica]AHC15753.1 2-isopropylmalate synthase [Salinispira pacifica]
MSKYKAYPQVNLHERQWPNNRITRHPLWCTVDLRDGNQALAQPMNIQEKERMFNLLVEMGFKQIEIGFPSASQIEYDFLRTLIDNNMVPDDVAVQVLTQSRKHLIERTVQSLKGVKRAVLHLYNSTSEQQRRITFRKNKEEIKQIALEGTQNVIDLLDELENTELIFQYSPESFTGTELEYAVEVCDAVIDLWDPAKRGKMIINLPATVELSTPNIFADQIEWMIRHLKRRDEVIISLHTHNDRGTGVAATELGLMAGADRVEGTLFGNGERTGNVDIITLALNMYSQGVDPGLDLHNIPRIRRIYEETTRMHVHERHPYGGDLVFTAFSGSHQDAISKGMALVDKDPQSRWDVPYLPIDPQDIGRSYEAIIRINSQSGKGGVAYVLENEYGLKIPRSLQPEIGTHINSISDQLVRELSSSEIKHAFDREYVNRRDKLALAEYALSRGHHSGDVNFHGSVELEGTEYPVEGTGNGPISAFMNGLNALFDLQMSVAEYEEQAIGAGSATEAAAYIRVEARDGHSIWGVGRDTDTSAAQFTAILSAMNRWKSMEFRVHPHAVPAGATAAGSSSSGEAGRE